MNFLRSRSLKQLSIYVLFLMILIFVAEYFGIRYHIRSLEEAERKIDFVRGIQIAGHQIALQIQWYTAGNKDLSSPISSQIDKQDHQLKTLAEGGRIDDTKLFIKPLSRLPRITFDNLREQWENYKAVVTGIIMYNTPSLPIAVDSLATETIAHEKINTSFEPPKIIHEARWLSLSDWFNRLVSDLEEEVKEKQQAILNWFILFIVFDSIVLVLLLYSFYKLVVQPLRHLKTNVVDHVHTQEVNTNEIGEVTHEINEIIENLKDATDFVVAIGEGKLDMDYRETLDLLYTPGKNKLADSLIQMQKKLKAMNEDEAKRQWANEGITKFVEIMRSSNDNLISLGDSITSALVQYTNSNQGALYILNDDDPANKYLELISLFAFDIKKFEQRKVKLGEGILGQTFLEKETTHLTNIPDEYIRITSGLGDASPKSLLLFPLKVDREAYGIIELASFNEYEEHEIAFVEKLGESIAATLGSVKAAQKNRQLIEQFQQQTEEMRAQEEEMRQNMEELQATQEEVGRKEQAYLVRIKELEMNVKDSDLEIIRDRANKMEQELRSKIEELTGQLAQKSLRADDWLVAEEMEKTFKINLEAIKITQEELNRKAGH